MEEAGQLLGTKVSLLAADPRWQQAAELLWRQRGEMYV